MLAAEVAAVAERHLERLRGAPEGSAALDASNPRVRQVASRVFGTSDFVAEACIREPRLLLAPELIEARSGLPVFAPEVETETEPEFADRLRRWRRHELVRIAWRDLAGWANLEQTLADLSSVADVAIRAAERFGRAQLVTRFGEPRGAQSGEPQPLVIVGMGKLGGQELNFSSDVDLVFLFPEPGDTDGARTISNEEFFGRLGQSVIRLLDAPSAEGIVFRVDMRLRPFGESGPLASSFAALEDYLQTHGRDWERYAWVKARAITGPEAYAEIQSSAVRPFVYRRYLDFGVFESLRELKALIEREVQRRELEMDIKLGPGGIREVEFIVQSFQLIRGGQDRRLQQTSLLAVLPWLAGGKGLPRGVTEELRDAYRYLRRLENRLQMLRDQQTHRVPSESIARLRLAAAMGNASWDELFQDLVAQRALVARHFSAVIVAARGRDAASQAEFAVLWDDGGEAESLLDWLRRAGVRAAERAAAMLVEFRASPAVRRLDAIGRRRLQQLLPVLLEEVGGADGAPDILRRALRIFEAVGSRSAYFALLRENSGARRRLRDICAAGDFLANQIALHPLLLDELLDERLFEDLPQRAELANELALRMDDVRDEDPEMQVERLRAFQRAVVFRIAVADLTGRLPVMRVSDRLTEVAELIIAEAMQLAWTQMTAQFGTPRCGPERRVVRICAVGYGKLGGLELGYGSDLDLVFLHDSEGGGQQTDATHPLENGLFFVRLAQRILHLLTVHSAAGRLYEVDMRLRPSGKGGMLITHIAAFAEYQRVEAWTWEHQALLHARAIAGAPPLRAQFERVRFETLTTQVRRERLAADVRDMRARMVREHGHGQRPGEEFNVKRDAGGITDIEFLAQYWALEFASTYPPVVYFSDTIRELESVASADLVPQPTVDVLTHTYRAYRAFIHHRSLEQREPIAGAAEFDAERRAVRGIWEQTFGSGPT
jgi:glutamate-ammonia-ligase adenylyltransferase